MMMNGSDLRMLTSRDGEASALYGRDGQLITVGDTDNVYDQLLQLLGVVTDQTDDFMLGQTAWNKMAQSLTQVDEYTKQRLTDEAQAKQLREQAKLLVAEADRLDRTRRQRNV